MKHNNYSNIPDIDVRGHLKHNNYSNIPDIDVRGHTIITVIYRHRCERTFKTQ